MGSISQPNRVLRGDTPPKKSKKSIFQILLFLKLDDICDSMQKTASQYLLSFQNGRCSKLTRWDILLYKKGPILANFRQF